MIFYVLRTLFVLLMAAVGWSYFTQPPLLGTGTWVWIVCSVAIGVLFVAIDVFSPRKKLAILSGAFFGLLVGVAIAFALSFVVRLLIEAYYLPATSDVQYFYARREAVIRFINMLIGVVSCYLAISFIIQTKDDFRFIIPYVEFSKQTKGARPILLDTSVLIDGRIADIAGTGILESQLIVPSFVLEELHAVADSGDRLKRNRGRRGLDVLARLRHESLADVVLYDAPAAPDGALAVDQRLMHLAKDLSARVLSNDSNLNKIAQLSGVDVVNINDLANALKPVVLPGEKLTVLIVKPGEESGQGVGYLADGTMVVVEQARAFQGEEVEFTVSRALQTSAGRMVFGRLGEAPATPARRAAFKE